MHMAAEIERGGSVMVRHTAHGRIVEDVYEAARAYSRMFNHQPSRIDETFAGFRFDGKKEFFLWQRKHLEDHLGKEVMAKVKYGDQQAIKCDTMHEVDEMYRRLSAQGVNFISKPAHYEWNAYCVYFLDSTEHMWEIYCWTGEVPPGDKKNL